MHGLLQVSREDLRSNRFISLILLLVGLRCHCRVVGDSMVPTLFDGDLIIYKPFRSNRNKDLLSEGLLIVLSHPMDKETLIVKRISKVNSSSLEILGDNELNSIDSRQFGLINKILIKGIVEKVISNVK